MASTLPLPYQHAAAPAPTATAPILMLYLGWSSKMSQTVTVSNSSYSLLQQFNNINSEGTKLLSVLKKLDWYIPVVG
jgi:hypothetical protein